MTKDETEGYRKVLASELSRSEQERLRAALREELAEALITSIKADPPDVNLAEIELVLRPGREIDDWNVAADCGTCGTCGTCVTCITT